MNYFKYIFLVAGIVACANTRVHAENPPLPNECKIVKEPTYGGSVSATSIRYEKSGLRGYTAWVTWGSPPEAPQGEYLKTGWTNEDQKVPFDATLVPKEPNPEPFQLNTGESKPASSSFHANYRNPCKEVSTPIECSHTAIGNADLQAPGGGTPDDDDDDDGTTPPGGGGASDPYEQEESGDCKDNSPIGYLSPYKNVDQRDTQELAPIHQFKWCAKIFIFQHTKMDSLHTQIPPLVVFPNFT